MDAFWSPLSFGTTLEGFRCVKNLFIDKMFFGLFNGIDVFRQWPSNRNADETINQLMDENKSSKSQKVKILNFFSNR